MCMFPQVEEFMLLANTRVAQLISNALPAQALLRYVYGHCAGQ